MIRLSHDWDDEDVVETGVDGGLSAFWASNYNVLWADNQSYIERLSDVVDALDRERDAERMVRTAATTGETPCR